MTYHSEIKHISVMHTATESAAQVSVSEGVIRKLFLVQAVTFGVVGVIFLLFPNGTVRVVNAVGASLRVFSPAPQSDLRFWLSLGVSYMALVTLLATLIYRDPRRHRSLMPVLACGKFCSSATCLLFFIFSSPAFLYLLNFVVDGSIAVVVLGCYAWMAIVGEPAQQAAWTKRTAPILEALIDTLLPENGAFALGGRQTPLAEDLWQYVGQLHVRGALGFALLLHGLEYGPYVLGPKPRRFTRLSSEERQRYLSGFERSRVPLGHHLIRSLKLIIMLHFYNYPEVQRTIGYDGRYLREKLLAGPNAAHHRVRLQ